MQKNSYLFSKKIISRQTNLDIKSIIKVILWLALSGILFYPVNALAGEQQSQFTQTQEPKIIVREFEIVGNTIFRDRQLQEILAPFKNKPITYAEVLKAVTEITNKYQENDYFLSLVFLPPQPLNTGVIKIQVVEGYFSKINVKIDKKNTITPKYVIDRLKPKIVGKPITMTELESALIVLRNQDLVRDLSIEGIDKDGNTGLAVLSLKVVGENKFGLVARTDNWQTPFLGTNNRIISGEVFSLLKTGDRLIVGYRNNDGSNAGSGGYELPINSSGGKIRILGGNYASAIVAAPFNQPNPESNFQFARGEFSQPVLETPTETLVLGGGLGWKQDENFLLGEPFPFGRGGDNGKTTVSSANFFQEYTRRSNFDVLRLYSQFELGLGLFDAEQISRFDSEFFIWRANTEYSLLLEKDLRLVLRGGLQLATDELASLEKFNIGGPPTVPGYRSFLISGDNGILGRTDLEITLFRPKEDHALELIPFFAFGKAWNNSRIDPVFNGNLTSTGAELRYNIFRKFEAGFGCAIKLNNNPVNNISNSLQEKGCYFDVIYRIF